jgi:hypothetical protein
MPFTHARAISLWQTINPLLNWTIKRGTLQGRKNIPETCKLSKEQKTQLLETQSK